jgi:ureidoacrylate peracid hydrolase
MKNIALLVIDIQNDFVERDAIIEIYSARKNINKLKSFIDFCRRKKILVIYTRHCYDPKKNPIERKLFPELQSGGLRKKTKGWDIYSLIAPQKDDIIINKSRYDAFFNTRLHSILKRKGITKFIITGTMTEVCCESTARSAMMKDYEVLFCSDLTFTASPKMQERTLEVVSRSFGSVCTSTTLKRKL